MNIVSGIFFILHGLVHLLYFGQSRRYFQLGKLEWPDDSWFFKKLVNNEAARIMAANALVLAAIGFVLGGILIFASHGGWFACVVISAIFSSAIFILFWDGKPGKLADKGLFAILINAALLVLVLAVKWPDFGF